MYFSIFSKYRFSSALANVHGKNNPTQSHKLLQVGKMWIIINEQITYYTNNMKLAPN